MISRHYRCSRIAGVLAAVMILPLLVATGAMAVREPVDVGPRPGPHAFEVQTPVAALDPVTDGFVNRATGALATLVNQHAGPYTGSPEEVARAYLREHAASFGLGPAGGELVLLTVQTSPGNQHARFYQAMNGVPVWGAQVVVTMDEAAQYVLAVYSDYDPSLAQAFVATTPALDPARAMEIAIQAVGIRGEPQFLGEPLQPYGLWIVREEDRAGSPARLAWRICLPVLEPMGDWEVFVDAQSGRVLRLTDQMVFVNGSGYAFDPDPLTTARVAYGTPGYTDGSDADTPQLTAQRFLRTLPDLTYIAPLYYLRGPWVYIDEFEPPTSPPATEADPDDFTYTRNQQEFEDANVYFQIDNSQRYMQWLGYSTIQHAPIHVDTHGLNGDDNSHYIPSSNRIAYGEGGVDDAEDADVILHEYGHAIQNSINPGWGGSTQARSMGEGFGDYWAGSYSAGISDYRDYWVFNWDGHNPFWSGRVLNSTLGYPNLNGDIYHDGTIWASLWWLIRGECGQTVTDNVMLKLHFGLGTSPGMIQAGGSAMQADKTLYGGLHTGSIDYYFTLRNFWTAAQYDVPALTHTPLGDQEGLGPYPVTVTIASTSAIVANSVILKFGTRGAFTHQVVLQPTGGANEWGGEIPGQGAEVDIRYYIQADNTAGWRGATPRGAEFQYYEFHVSGSSVADQGQGRPLVLSLAPANPNPFPALTNLRFDLPQAGEARLTVFDVTGRAVRTIVGGNFPAGSHSYVWDGRDDSGRDLASGIYFARLVADGKSLSRKLLLAR